MKRTVILAAFTLAACSGSTTDDDGLGNTNRSRDGGTAVQSTVVADFSLLDQNGSSPRSNTNVSPRDYLQKVSGWYFTHAT